MKKQKKILYMLTICIISLLIYIQLPQKTLAQTGTLVEYTEEDNRVIPDKYNTGCSGALTVAPLDTTNGTAINNVLFIAGSGNTGTRRVLDFYYRNKEVTGTVYFENYDFSNYPLWTYNLDKVDRKIKLVFNNCKFSSVTVGRAPGNVTFEFNNCTMNSFSGSDATFNRCQFGNSYSDGLVPYCNVNVNDCYFKDMASVATEGGVHTDGTQLYGIEGTEVSNIVYTNCRFEIPPLKAANSNAYINACIMFQIEYNNANGVAFNDCIVNGGGFTIYATNKYSDKYTINNVTFDGIKFGCACKYGIFYTKINTSVKITDVSETDALYIGSVWKESGQTHFSVTNDTNRERTLLIYTDKGEFTYTIPACTKGSELTETMTYADMPFDMDIVVPADCRYAVCFDSTLSGCGKQIRFVNWSGSQVYLPDTFTNAMYAGTNDVLVSGSCGKNITFTLTKAGVLTLSGTGDTYNYNSQKFPDWIAYKDYIKEVYVQEGIEGLGSMIFRQCTSIEKVQLPSSLKTIGQYAFGGCVSLDEFTFPKNITVIGNSVISGVPLSQIHYAGDNWAGVTIGINNENLLERLVIDSAVVEETESVVNEITTSKSEIPSIEETTKMQENLTIDETTSQDLSTKVEETSKSEAETEMESSDESEVTSEMETTKKEETTKSKKDVENESTKRIKEKDVEMKENKENNVLIFIVLGVILLSVVAFIIIKYRKKNSTNVVEP